MEEEFELPEIDINEIKLYPEMDKKIASLLMIRNDDVVSLYAAKLIQRYQAARCGTCKYRNSYGHCESNKLGDSFFEHTDESSIDMLITTNDEGGDCFRVGDKFGCVHHSEKEHEK